MIVSLIAKRKKEGDSVRKFCIVNFHIPTRRTDVGQMYIPLDSIGST